MPRSAADAHPVDLHVGAMIRTERRRAGMTQVALAEIVGLTFQQVQKYERGFNRVSASKLYDIATALNLPIAAFFDGLEPSTDGIKESLLVMMPQVSELIGLLSQLDLKTRKAFIVIARTACGVGIEED